MWLIKILADSMLCAHKMSARAMLSFPARAAQLSLSICIRRRSAEGEEKKVAGIQQYCHYTGDAARRTKPSRLEKCEN